MKVTSSTVRSTDEFFSIGDGILTIFPFCFQVGQTERQMDGQRNTPAAHGLEEPFSAVLERFLQPIHTFHV